MSEMQAIDCYDCDGRGDDLCPTCRGAGIVERPIPPMQRFVWTVEIAVHPDLVADGLDLTPTRLHDLLTKALSHARMSHIAVLAVAGPKPDDVAQEQGYRSDAHRKQVRGK